MKMLNKMVKALAFLGIRLVSDLALALLSLVVTSPFYCLAVCIADRIKMPSFAQGRLLYIWLILSCPLFIGFVIYVEVKIAKQKRNLKHQKK